MKFIYKYFILLIGISIGVCYAGYAFGNQSGFEFGDNQGYIRGFNSGFIEGNSTGFKIGYDTGFSNGSVLGINNGYTEGNKIGYEKGYTYGIDIGYQTGYNSGAKEGFDFGYTNGKSYGYTKGYNYTYPISYSLGYKTGNSTGFKTGYLNGFASTGNNLRNPTYQEVINFVNSENINSKDSDQLCISYKNDAFNKQYMTYYVYIKLYSWPILIGSGPNSAHSIIAFNTVDKGIIYIDPQWKKVVNVEVGKDYFTENGYSTFLGGCRIASFTLVP